MKFTIFVNGDEDLTPESLSIEDLREAKAGVYVPCRYKEYYIIIFPAWNDSPAAIVALNMSGKETKAFDPGEWEEDEQFERVNAEIQIGVGISKVEVPEFEIEGFMQ